VYPGARSWRISHVLHEVTTLPASPVLLLAVCAHRQGVPDEPSVIDLLIGNVAMVSLQDIAASREIRAVVLKGDYLDRAALDAMLAAVRARVAARETEAH